MSARLAAVAIALAGAAAAQLPPIYVPAQNPQTPAKIVLGKVLFWDEQLSSDDTVACGTCHLPEFGGSDPRVDAGLHPGHDGVFGTDDDVHGSPGIVRQATNAAYVPSGAFELRRQATGRVSPSNLGAGHHAVLFWDGRASTTFVDPETGAVLIPFAGALESQAIGPILNPVEMAREGRTWQDVRQKLQTVPPLRLASDLTPDLVAALQQNPTYPLLFTAAFGDSNITAARIAFALAAYQRTLNPDDTPWDRFMSGLPGAMTPMQQVGWAMFQNQGRCISCHWAPVFSDDLVHNLGLRYNVEDIGAMAVTGLPFELGAFKTPTLRNAGLRPRLFHNGQSPALGDLAQATDPGSTLNVYFMGGGVDLSNVDAFLLPLKQFGVSLGDLRLIQEFVRTALTDERAALALPPFDHPTLRSQAVAQPRRFGPALPGVREPDFVATAPAFPGNLDFRLGLGGGDGAGLGLVSYGLQSIEPSLTVAGLPWSVAAIDLLLVPLPGSAGQPGHTTWPLPIPNDPGLVNLALYFQLFAADAGAPGGIAASRGLEVRVQ